jgi:hypothetical protein
MKHFVAGAVRYTRMHMSCDLEEFRLKSKHVT